MFNTSSSGLRDSRSSHDDICFRSRALASDELAVDVLIVEPNVLRLGVIVVDVVPPVATTVVFAFNEPINFAYLALTGVFRDDIFKQFTNYFSVHAPKSIDNRHTHSSCLTLFIG